MARLFCLTFLVFTAVVSAEMKLKPAATLMRHRSLSGSRHAIVPAAEANALEAEGGTVLSRSGGSVVMSLPASSLREAASVAPSSKMSDAAAEEQTRHFLILFYSDVDDSVADGLLASSGVEILSRPDLVEHQRLVKATLSQAVELAEWDEVAYLYPASDDLVAGMPVQGCRGPATEEGPIAHYVSTVGQGWPDAQGELALTYSLSSSGQQVTPEVLLPVIQRALAEWSRHAKLTFEFREAAGLNRNLDFLLGARAHGDNYPFDGRGRVLAHTFYPVGVNREPIAGDIHLDDDELWSSKIDPDLYSVILHEIGHALGLGHADRPGSVMYPYYRRLESLQADDISALNRLYAARTTAAPGTVPVTTATGSMALPLELRVAGVAPSTTAATVSLSGTIVGGTAPFQITWSNGYESRSMIVNRSWILASIPLRVGANTISVSVSDSAGSSHGSTVSIQRETAPAVEDKTAPALTITSPAVSISATSAVSATLRGTARDAGGIQEITWTSSAGASGTGTGTTAWQIVGVPLIKGDNSIRVQARDTAGNTTNRTITITRR